MSKNQRADLLAPCHQISQGRLLQPLLAVDGVPEEARRSIDWVKLEEAGSCGHSAVLELFPQGKRPDNVISDDRDVFPLPLLPGTLATAVDDLKRMIAEDAFDVNVQTEHGFTLLMRASNHGTIELVNFLLDLPNINPHLVDVGRRSAISWAARAGKIDALRSLMGFEGIDLNIQDVGSQTPLMWACRYNKPETALELLKSRLLQVNQQDHN